MVDATAMKPEVATVSYSNKKGGGARTGVSNSKTGGGHYQLYTDSNTPTLYDMNGIPPNVPATPMSVRSPERMVRGELRKELIVSSKANFCT